MTTERQRLQVQLETTLQKFEQEMRRAVKTGAVSAQQIEQRFAQLSTKLAVSGQKAARGISGYIGLNKQAQFVLQNTANQISDIAVQLEGGTNAFRVFGQQLPQIFGGLGALGGAFGVFGPILGTITALALPAAAAIFTFGSDSGDSSKKVQTLVEKLNEAESALQRANKAAQLAGSGGLEDLERIYGSVTEKVRELAQALADIEIKAAQTKVESLLDGIFAEDFGAKINEQIGGAAGAVLETSAEDVENLRREIRLLEQEISAALNPEPGLVNQLSQMREELAAVTGDIPNLGSLEEAFKVDPADVDRIRELQTLIPEMIDERAFAAAADGISELRSLLEGIGVEVRQGMFSELTAVEDLIRKMEQALVEAEKAAEGTGDAASGIASGLSPAVAQARALAAWLGTSLATATRLASFGPQGVPQTDVNGDVYSGRGGDPRQFGGGAANRALYFETGGVSVDQLLKIGKFAPKSRRGSGKSEAVRAAQKEFNKNQRDAEKWIRASETALEEYNRKLERLAELNDQGFFKEKPEAYAKAVEGVTQEFVTGIPFVQDFKDSILDAASGGRDAFKNLGESIKRAALELLIFNSGPLKELFGLFGGGGGGNIVGTLLGGLFGGFKATGGSVTPGKLYGINERGAEPFVPQVPGYIVSYNDAKRALSNGGGEGVLNVRMYVDQGGNWQAAVEQISGRVSAQVVQTGIAANNRQQKMAQERR